MRFREIYKPWGISEPWERVNMERFFYLRAYMRREALDSVWYLDSDVMLLRPLPRVEEVSTAPLWLTL
jgi:hypothetical protein